MPINYMLFLGINYMLVYVFPLAEPYSDCAICAVYFINVAKENEYSYYFTMTFPTIVGCT
jgi:hypothetical protein